MKTWEERGRELAFLVATKQSAYGDSITRTEEMLECLWPQGIPPECYSDALLVIRVMDKVCRIVHSAGSRDALGESPWCDIAGYAMRGWAQDDERTNTNAD